MVPQIPPVHGCGEGEGRAAGHKAGLFGSDSRTVRQDSSNDAEHSQWAVSSSRSTLLLMRGPPGRFGANADPESCEPPARAAGMGATEGTAKGAETGAGAVTAGD